MVNTGAIEDLERAYARIQVYEGLDTETQEWTTSKRVSKGQP